MANQSPYWSRFWRQRQSRRRVLAGSMATGAGLAGFALVGCGDDDDDDNGDPTATSGNGSPSATASASPTGSAGEPVSGGEIVYNQGAPNTDSLDPHTTLNASWSRTGFISDKLVSPDHASLEPIHGETVEDWEQVDETTLNLTVRSGIMYHQEGAAAGRAFTAEDVAYNLMRIAGKLDPDRVALFQRSTTLANMDTAEAIDESTVQVTFTAPNSQFLNGMADWRNWLVSQEGVEAEPNFNDLRPHSATGAFILTEWDEGQRIGTYVRNENYWKGAPYLDQVRQVSIPDPASSQSAFLTGQTGFYRASSREQREAVEQDGIIIDSWEHVGWEYFRMNQSREPFTNPDFRRAIFLALHPTEMMNFNYGEGYWDYTGPLVSGMPGAWTSDEVSQMLGFNPDTREEAVAEARALMEAAGFPNGDFSFTITASPVQIVPWNNNAHVGRDFLLEVWPDADISIAGDDDIAGYARVLGSGEWDIFTYASFPPPSAVVEGSLHYRTGGGRNYTDYSNPDVDALFEQIYAEFDGDARNELINELQQMLLDDVFASPLGKAREVNARQANIRGFNELWQPGPGSFASYDPVFSAHTLWLEPEA